MTEHPPPRREHFPGGFLLAPRRFSAARSWPVALGRYNLNKTSRPKPEFNPGLFMISKLASACLAALFLALLLPCGPWAKTSLREGDPTPEHVFPAPEDPADKRYLGIRRDAAGFRLNQVAGDVLVVEFFNRRCRHCQSEAPNVNRLFELIRARGLGNSIKLLGVGARNNKNEVELFRRRHQIPFPLVPDPELAAFNAFGGQGTPRFLVVRLKEKPTVVMIVSGFLPEPPDALEEIMRKSGLQTN